jgi:hypothetical protein
VEQVALGGAVALADDQLEPAAGEVVEGGVVLEGAHRVEQGQRGDRGEQPDPRGQGGDVAEHHGRRGGDERPLVPLSHAEPVEAEFLGQARVAEHLPEPVLGGLLHFMRAVERDDPDRFALGTAALGLHRRSGIVTMDEMSGVHALRTATAGAPVPAGVVASAQASGNPGFRALVGHALAEAGDPAGGVRLLGPAAPGQAPGYAALAADCLRTAVFAAAGRAEDTRSSLDRITAWSGELVLYGNADHLGAVDYFIALGLAALGEAGAARHARAAAGRCAGIGNRPWARRAAVLAGRLAAGKPAGNPAGSRR